MKKLKAAYDAYWRLNDNYDAWPIRSLDISLMAIDPERGEINFDDESKNTEIIYCLEGGPWFEDENCAAYSHDYDLNCGGNTFEEAIIEYEKLVIKHYGKNTDAKGIKSKLTEPKS